MRRVIIVCCLLILISFTGTNSVAAKEAENTNAGPLFGGQWVQANNTSSQTIALNQLPAIAEDYTATWCTNCVKVEHTLEDLELEGILQKYHFHRANDHEDPFGSEKSEQHYKERYGIGPPPIVVFNGTQKQIGSTPNSDSLEDDYRALISQPLNLGNGNTTFSWASQDGVSGVVSWAVDIDMAQFTEYEMSVNAWIVEGSAEFEDGSNGEEIYPSIVRDIINLGSNTTGTASITLPDTFDGDDLQVHLMYHFTSIVIDDDSSNEISSDEKEDTSLPSISLIAGLSTIIAAAAIFTRD